MTLLNLYFRMFDTVVSAENDHCQMRGAAFGSPISHKEKEKLMQYSGKARQIVSSWYISTGAAEVDDTGDRQTEISCRAVRRTDVSNEKFDASARARRTLKTRLIDILYLF